MPRATLPHILAKMRTMEVLLTKTTKEEVFSHIEDKVEEFETIVDYFKIKLSKLVDYYMNTNVFEKYSIQDWRNHKVELKYRKDKSKWITDGGEKDQEQYILMLNIINDINICISAYPEWEQELPNIMFLIESSKFDIDELLGYETLNYNESKEKYEEADKDYIAEKDLKFLHIRHKPKAYWVEKFNNDPDCVKFYKGIIPDNEDTCKYCIQDKAIREQKEQHLKEYEEAQKFKNEEYMKEMLLRQAEERKKWIETRKELVCGICEFKTFSMSQYETHINSREHTALANRKKWYCDCCETQSRSETEHQFHLGTTKHKNRIIGKDENYVETFKCECCNYETTRKDVFKKHTLSKQHIQKAQSN